MFRNFVAAVAAICFVAGGLSAAEYKGKIKSVDVEGKKITIVVGKKNDTKDLTIAIDDKAKFSTIKTVDDKEVAETLTDGLKNDIFSKLGKGGPSATITTTGEGKDEKATEIKVSAGKKKKNT